MSCLYDEAKKIYAKVGIDTDKVIERLSQIPISIHCWQGDDVGGFESSDALSGGIQVTGNYPGKARNIDELMSDLDVALSLIPGIHRINLHSVYADYSDGFVPRNKLTTDNFEKWISFAEKRNMGLDINPTLFSHPLASDGLTLSHPDEKIREFWIEHCKAVRKIGADIGKRLGTPCLNNIWIPDGYKEIPADRLGPRKRLKESLDEIFSVKYDKKYLLDSVESKVFGIGVESYTVGSHEFYMNYAAANGCLCLLDNGHYHPTENVADKISSMLLFSEKVALHVTRSVRWDSDHVVGFNDEIKDIANEIVKAGTENVLIGLDYFDGGINRIAAWVLGTRNMQKALLNSLLTPFDKLSEYQNNGNFTEMLMLSEEVKTYPLSAVWDKFCELNNVPVREEWFETVKNYENSVLSERK